MSKCTCAFPCGGTDCAPTSTEKYIQQLEQQLFETQHELAIRMNILHEYPWCCAEAKNSNGWHHNIKCVNWRLCY